MDRSKLAMVLGNQLLTILELEDAVLELSNKVIQLEYMVPKDTDVKEDGVETDKEEVAPDNVDPSEFGPLGTHYDDEFHFDLDTFLPR